MTWILLLFAFVAGACVPVQFGVNTQLRSVVGGPAIATAISFFVGTIAAVIVALILRESLPEVGSISNAPWWVDWGFAGRNLRAGIGSAYPPSWCRDHS